MGFLSFYKVIAYTMLCTALSVGGSLFSSIMHYIGIPQYICNFIFGLIITLYALENLVLFSDLKKCNEILQNNKAHSVTIKNLSNSNDYPTTHIHVLTIKHPKRHKDKGATDWLRAHIIKTAPHTPKQT